MGRNLSRAETDPAGVLMLHSYAQLAGLVLAIVSVSLAGGLWAGGVALGLSIVLVSTALESGR